VDINLGGQRVIWQVCTGRDDRDDRTYAAPQTIVGRAVRQHRDLIDAKGEVITYEYAVQVLPPTAVEIDDLINGRMVISVVQQVALDGTTVGYLAYTR